MTRTDRYDTHAKSLIGSIVDAFDISPSDDSDLPEITRQIYVGGSGDLRVTLKDQADGESITYQNLPAGYSHSKRVKKVWDTGTTATNIIGEV